MAPGKIGLLIEKRLFFTVAYRSDSAGLDTEIDEIIADVDCPFLTQGKVVFLGAAVIAITFDNYGVGNLIDILGILNHPVGHVGSDKGLVEIKIDRDQPGGRTPMHLLVLIALLIHPGGGVTGGAAVVECSFNGKTVLGIGTISSRVRA